MDLLEAAAADGLDVPAQLVLGQPSLNLALDQQAPRASIVNHDVWKPFFLRVILGVFWWITRQPLFANREGGRPGGAANAEPGHEVAEERSILVQARSQGVSQAILRLGVLVEEASHCGPKMTH
jgi:hypothetical protein